MTENASRSQRPLFALQMRLLAIFLLSTMSALIKLADSRGAHLAETMFFRQFFAVPVAVGCALVFGGGLRSLATKRITGHLWRTVVGLVGMVFTFGSVILLPLAESTTFQFTVPIFATLLSVAFLGEKAGIHRWGAILFGFIGVLIVAQPGDGHIPLFGAFVGLVAAFLVALVAILLRQLGSSEAAITTTFWFSALSVLPLGIAYPFVAQAHDFVTWAIFVAIGVIGGFGQIALTAAMRWGSVSTVVPMDYSGLIWATLYGWLVFGVFPVATTWLGAPVIIASGLYIVWREHRLSRRNTEAAVAID